MSYGGVHLQVTQAANQQASQAAGGSQRPQRSTQRTAARSAAEAAGETVYVLSAAEQARILRSMPALTPTVGMLLQSVI